MESNGTTIQYVFFIKMPRPKPKRWPPPGRHHRLHANHPSFTADLHNAEWHCSTAELEQPMVSKTTCNASNTKVKTCSADKRDDRFARSSGPIAEVRQAQEKVIRPGRSRSSGRLFGRSLKGKSAHDWREYSSPLRRVSFNLTASSGISLCSL